MAVAKGWLLLALSQLSYLGLTKAGLEPATSSDNP